MVPKQAHQLFTREKIEAITRRIALQILESNLEEPTLYLVGIADNGLLFADRIATSLRKHTQQPIEVIALVMDKTNPQQPIQTSIEISQCENKAVIIVDDVLNTGSTLIYAVRHFLQVPLKKLQTAVLVNRNHKRFPIKADFKGVSLSTSFKEHVTVLFGGASEGVYLS